ncbi:MAG: hypothetical protein GFH27_549361n21 [Chloroflexi bacterium AL-W]|nr:hypothetical protein [Chloroflexi bacterium AL-N1]NOK70733.1 hypothetical protein [Chloroflexi bacterium AL-N10]NOK78293.1 hypothetical protein [Chloroflexi bacterium AL-N5]NOK85636.1 hypothetical protein [Chloroflexi bacterium AL-W]NOK92550.1 hypothetical protein [Chloroflexi bacterium AL-N15]
MVLLRYTGLLILMSLIILSSSNASPTVAMPVAQDDMPNDITVTMYVLNSNDSSIADPETLCTTDNDVIATRYGCSWASDQPYPYATNPITVSIDGDYLLDVVPRESNPERPFSFHRNAVNAQATAARTYAYYHIANNNNINNSIEYQAFVPYFFDRLGDYVGNSPTNPIPTNVNPCTDDFFDPGQITVEQQMICNAVGRNQYLSLSTNDNPIQSEFSADWPDGVVPELETEPKVDPISTTGNSDDPCAVSLEDQNASHGRGMTQFGANRWARGDRCAIRDRGSDRWSVRWTRPEQILTHYYTGVHLRSTVNGTIATPNARWAPLQIDWGAGSRQAPDMEAGASYPIRIQVQNTSVNPWTCNAALDISYYLSYTWSRWTSEFELEQRGGLQRTTVCDVDPGEARFLDITIDDVPSDWGAGTYTLRFDLVRRTDDGPFRFSEGGWPAHTTNVRLCPAEGCTRTAQTQDIVFVIDTTRSMDDDIAAVKASATDIVNALASSGDDYRVALVDYRDLPEPPYGEPGDYQTRTVLAFSSDTSTIISAIDSLTVGGGNDVPESVFSGLMQAINLSWRTDANKTIILMGDAAPHDPEPSTNYTLSAVLDAANAVGTSQRSFLAELITSGGGTVQIYPIAIGGWPNVEAAFQTIADGTGGTAFQANAASDVTDAVLEALDTVAQSPIADAGGPYTAPPDEPILLNGLNSIDPDGLIELYEWDTDSDGVFDIMSAEPVVTHTYTLDFEGLVTLRVTDNDGNTATDTAPVNGGPNTEPPPPNFAEAENYATGRSPNSIAIGDVNADTIPDLVTAGTNSHAISVLLGSGDGSFAPFNNYPVGTSPSDAAIGDIDNDGNPDVVVTDQSANMVYIMMGNGDGTFVQSPNSYNPGTHPKKVVLADLNNDNQLDIIVSNYVSNTISVLLGLGNGSFQAPVQYNVDEYPKSIVTTTIDNDQFLDVIVANEQGRSVSILLGNGNGILQAAVTYSLTGIPQSITVADFNNDGHADLAAALSQRDQNVNVLFNNGNGTFQTPISYTTGSTAWSITTGDVNQDGSADLVIGTYVYEQNQAINVHINNSDGTFQEGVSYPTGQWPYDIAIADLNNNNKLDVVTANLYSDDISVFLNR